MLDFVIIVNGVPGAGKTTPAAPLAQMLQIPLLAKDAIKEALFDAAGGAAPRRRIGILASESQWTIAGFFDGSLLLESFYAAGRDESDVERGPHLAILEELTFGATSRSTSRLSNTGHAAATSRTPMTPGSTSGGHSRETRAR